jgi:hypothetical protein
MKTFIQWAEEKKLDLPPLGENTKRAGIAHWAYPSAYAGRGYAYPDGYFMPHAADAMFKMSKKPNDKAAPANTPG